MLEFLYVERSDNVVARVFPKQKFQNLSMLATVAVIETWPFMHASSGSLVSAEKILIHPLRTYFVV